MRQGRVLRRVRCGSVRLYPTTPTQEQGTRLPTVRRRSKDLQTKHQKLRFNRRMHCETRSCFATILLRKCCGGQGIPDQGTTTECRDIRQPAPRATVLDHCGAGARREIVRKAPPQIFFGKIRKVSLPLRQVRPSHTWEYKQKLKYPLSVSHLKERGPYQLQPRHPR